MAVSKNITGNILRNAITKRLSDFFTASALFPNGGPKINNERKFQNFDENSFFVYQVSTDQVPVTMAYFKRNYLFSITFYPMRESPTIYAMLEDVKENLFDAMRLLEIPVLIDEKGAKKLIAGKNLAGRVSDGMLVFTVDFTLFVKPYEPQGDLMEELQMELIPALDYKEGIFIEKVKEV